MPAFGQGATLTIWLYPDVSRNPATYWHTGRHHCAFCNDSPLLDIDHGRVRRAELWTPDYCNNIYICSYCGWWIAEKEQWSVEPHMNARIIYGAAGSLRELDLTDQSIPIDDIQSFLMAKYASRNSINPHVLEKTVAGVFSGLGYATRVTAYSADGGIDVILENGAETIGVQVKRYKNKIKVEQIRAFAGALILHGITNGIFITTSDFQRGARKAVSDLETKGYKIELCNSTQFYDAMKLSRRHNSEAVAAELDKNRIMANLIEVERKYECDPRGP